MVPLSALNLNAACPVGLQFLTSFVAIQGTDFPALSMTNWDYDANPPLSSVQIFPRYAQLIYVVNQ
jgi:hypothetical protein